MVRHKSGRYYARLYLNGKEIWKTLETSHYSVAEARLVSTVKEHREKEGHAVASANAKMTFGEAARLHMQRLDENVSIKRRTRKYWREIHAALQKLARTGRDGNQTGHRRRLSRLGNALRENRQRHAFQRHHLIASQCHRKCD